MTQINTQQELIAYIKQLPITVKVAVYNVLEAERIDDISKQIEREEIEYLEMLNGLDEPTEPAD